jgi:hypothetical protein
METRKITFILVSALLMSASSIDLRADDYQYQYFHGEDIKHVPFSDYIPRIRLHYRTVPHYLEDYYELYGLKLHYNENTLRMNIERLKTALQCKFRHPSDALVKIESEKEYFKYRNLMFMHINLIIMRNYMRIASRYDQQKIRFHSAPFAKEINESFILAEKYYTDALPYWEEAVKYARVASTVKITTDLGYIESERFSILKGDLDFKKIINDHLSRIQKKKETLNSMAVTKQ